MNIRYQQSFLWKFSIFYFPIFAQKNAACDKALASTFKKRLKQTAIIIAIQWFPAANPQKFVIFHAALDGLLVNSILISMQIP